MAYQKVELEIKMNKKLPRLIRATQNSLAGLCTAWTKEQAFRQELLICIVLLPIIFLIKAGILAKLVLVLLLIFLMVIELMNSAIEAAIDRISMEPHQLSKEAKDLGSAAVFGAILMNVVAWVLVLLV